MDHHKRNSINSPTSPMAQSEPFNLSSLPSALRLSGMKKNSKVFSSSNYLIDRLNSDDIVDSLISSDIEAVLRSEDEVKIREKVEAIHHGDDAIQISSLVKGALRSGRLDLAKASLAKLEVSKHNHYKLLHCAASCNEKEFCQMLIHDFGLSVSAFVNKESPVHVAAKNGHVSLLAYFLDEADGDLNGSDDKQNPWTPMHSAVTGNALSSVNYLLRKKADLALKSFSSTPLHIAAEHNRADCIQSILESGSAMVDQVRGQIQRETPLHIASAGMYHSARVLLNYGANPDEKNGNGETPLHIACKHLQSDLINLLLNYDASVNARDHEERTPLHFLLNSRLKGRIECIEILVQKGADINMTDKNGMTPLHYAAINRRVKSLQFLIENKANLCLKNKNGQTALNSAVKYLPIPTMKAIERNLAKSFHIYSIDAPDASMSLNFECLLPSDSNTNTSHVQVFHELLPLFEKGQQAKEVTKLFLHPVSQCCAALPRGSSPSLTSSRIS